LTLLLFLLSFGGMAPSTSRRKVDATAELTTEPLETLPPSNVLARVDKVAGNNLYNVRTASGEVLLVELPSKFRSAIWLRRGGFVVVDTATFTERDNKLGGQVVNIIRNEKKWRRTPYWYGFQ